MTTSKQICPRKKGGAPLFNALATSLSIMIIYREVVPRYKWSLQQLSLYHINFSAMHTVIHVHDCALQYVLYCDSVLL